MTHYSYAQLEGLWINAGGDRSLAPLMAAIAEAESSGNSTAENTTDNGGTQTSWGLWQISNGTHNEPVPNILDPAVNARAAVAKYHSQGLGAWGTYTSGAYRAFLNGSTTPATNVPSGGSAGAGSTGGSGPGGGGGTAGSNIVLTSTIVAGTCVLPLNIPIAGQFCLLSKSQARGFIGAMLILGGGLLVLPGLLVLAAAGLGQTGAGRAAGKAAEAVPTIRVARAAGGAARSRRASSPEAAPASPSPRPAPSSRPASQRPAPRPAPQRTGTRADARGTSPEFRRQFMGESG